MATARGDRRVSVTGTIITLACAFALGQAAGAERALGSTPTANSAEWRAQLAANEALGEQAAHELLAELQLPPGAAEAPTEPAGDGGYLAVRPRWGTGDTQAWFTAPGTTAETVAYINAHEPADALPGLSPRTIEPNSFSDITFAPGQGAVGARQLGVFVSQLPGAAVGVLAHAQVLVTRPRQQLPTRVRAVRVTVSMLDRSTRSRRTYLLLEPERIARLRAAIEALEPEPPSFAVSDCMRTRVAVTIRLLSSRRGRELAELGQACGGLSLTVEGDVQPTLSDNGVRGPFALVQQWLHYKTA